MNSQVPPHQYPASGEPSSGTTTDRDLALATLHLSAMAKAALSPGATLDLQEAFAGSFNLGLNGKHLSRAPH